MTIPMPWSLSKDDPSGQELEDRLQENFDKLAQQFPVNGANLSNDVLRLAVTGTSRKVAFGTATLTFTAAADSATLTVSHGLGVAPQLVLVQNTFVAGTRSIVAFVEPVANWTTTVFKTFGRSDAAFTGTSTHTWIAIG